MWVPEEGKDWDQKDKVWTGVLEEVVRNLLSCKEESD